MRVLIIPNAQNVEQEWKDRLKISKAAFGMIFIVARTAVRSGSDAGLCIERKNA